MEYLDLGFSVIQSIFDWFVQLDTEFKFLSAILSVFVINCVWRFLLAPVLGRSSGSSDTVKKERKK